MYTHTDVVEVGLASPSFTVLETSSFVEVCVSLLSDPAFLGEIVAEVQLYTQDGDALAGAG